jgi:hypothetical protein
LLSALVLLSALPALAKSAKVTILVVNSESGVRHWTQYVPGTAARSQTSCDSNASALSNGSLTTANGTATCNTTTTPGSSAYTVDHAIAQTWVDAVFPEGQHVQLWCQAGFRRRFRLNPGSYTAEIKGDTAWVYATRLDGKIEKIKYHSVGAW